MTDTTSKAAKSPGRENCTDILCLSRPDLVREIHHSYFAAGADMVETNSFGASPVTLGEFDLSERAFEINLRAGELAREAADMFADDRHRYVLGSIVVGGHPHRRSLPN